jgi:ferredoxin
MDPEGSDRLEERELTRVSEPDAERDRVDVANQWSWEDAWGKGLPTEPAAREGKPEITDPGRLLQQLLAFHLYGRRPADVGEATGPAPLPALLHPHRDLSRIRHDYPICLNGSGGESAVRPLTEIVDGLLAGIAGPDDAGEQRRRSVYRLESIIRSLVNEREGEPLAVLWDCATSRLLETSRLPDDKEKILRENVATARQALAADGDLVSCGPHTPERLLRSAMSVYWAEQITAWRDDLDLLISQLRNILNADFSQSEAAKSPEHLRESLGPAADDVDFQAMSSVLASRPHESALSEERRSRVEMLLATLVQVQPVFANPAAGSAPPFRIDAMCESVGAALAEHESRMRLMTDFFKSVRIARLEIQNRYHGGVHDPLFAQFDHNRLTQEELALCPPVLVRLPDGGVRRDEIEPLLSSLNGTAPIKILLVLSSLHRMDGGGGYRRATIAWPARLAAMAATLPHVYVFQAPVSRASALHTGLREGLRSPGPALFCIYAPAADDERALPTYLTAAAASESRVFPILTFDPTKGTTLAECIDLGENLQSDQDWPAERFSYESASGEEASREIAFTPADFLFCVDRGAGDFWTVPAEWWHESMTPVHEYLEMPAEKAAGRIPYVSIVDADGHVGRTVVTRAVIDFSQQCRSFWRGMQEWGGIHNSFAARLLAREQERLTREKDREVEAIERNYQVQLDQNVGELTKAIIQRIAAQLIGTEGATLPSRIAPPSAPPRPAAAATPVAVPAEKAQAAEPEEEDAASFDDPYIDTPLCTSCNECTRINGRMFAYNANKQAEIRDATAGAFSDLVRAAELCPVRIIHPGKPKNPSEAGLEELIKRAAPFN